MLMKELEDYDWFPTVLRKYQTDFIGYMVIKANLYAALVPLFKEFISKNSTAKIIDLCSGSGLPAIYMHQHAKHITTILTDKFPQDIITPKNIIAEKESVDVLQYQPIANTSYTMYNAFHHFSDKEQIAIVQKMRAHKAPFLFVEILQPNISNVLQIVFTTVIIQLLVTPFLKPFSWQRLFFTYIIPINLFTILFDGLVSVTKSKSMQQYKNLFSTINEIANYRVTVQKIIKFPTIMICIKGEPSYE